MDVSIIIVNYNTKDLTQNCLKSVFGQTKDIDFEVIVSDNGSTDGSIEMIEAEFPQVILIENNENLGFGAANNRGLKIAKGKYIFYLNSDTVLLNNAVKIFFDYFEENGEKENLGALGCRLQNENGEYIHSGYVFPSPKQQLKFLFRYFLLSYSYPFVSSLLRKKRQQISYGEIDYITGADLFLKNDLNARFDERYFMYCEEVDLQKELSLKNKKRCLMKEPQIIHFEGGSSGREKSTAYKFNTFGSINMWISNLKFLRKFYGNTGLVKVLPYLVTFIWCLPENGKATKEYRKQKKLFKD